VALTGGVDPRLAHTYSYSDVCQTSPPELFRLGGRGSDSDQEQAYAASSKRSIHRVVYPVCSRRRRRRKQTCLGGAAAANVRYVPSLGPRQGLTRRGVPRSANLKL
jgi:hypothetical protein